jgi:hypothetical protein
MRIKTVIKRVVIGIVIFFVAMWVIGFILIKTGYQPPAKDEPAQPLAETQEEQANEADTPQAPQSFVIEPQQMAIPEPSPQQSVALARSDNILLNSNLIEVPMINAVGRNVGTRAYITLPQEILLEVVTLEDVTEFFQSFQDKNYNVVTIMCPEGTGLVFSIAGKFAQFGKIDEYGRVAESALWSIWYDENSKMFKN